MTIDGSFATTASIVCLLRYTGSSQKGEIEVIGKL